MLAGLNRPAIHSFQLVTKINAGSIVRAPRHCSAKLRPDASRPSGPGSLAVVKAPAVGTRVGEHAQLAVGRVLSDADGDLLRHARRLVEGVLGIDLQPAPLPGAGRALEVVRLRLAEGEKATDLVVRSSSADPDRPCATTTAPSARACPAQLGPSVLHQPTLPLGSTSRAHSAAGRSIELEHQPGVVLDVSKRRDATRSRPASSVKREVTAESRLIQVGAARRPRKRSVDGKRLPERVPGGQLDRRGSPASLDAAAEPAGSARIKGLPSQRNQRSG